MVADKSNDESYTQANSKIKTEKVLGVHNEATLDWDKWDKYLSLLFLRFTYTDIPILLRYTGVKW